MDGTSYALVGDIAGLASAVGSDPNGHFALARMYDMTNDSTYQDAAAPGTLTGVFEASAMRPRM